MELICHRLPLQLLIQIVVPVVVDGRPSQAPTQYLARAKGGIPIGVWQILRRPLADTATTRSRLSFTLREVLQQ
jgi:hypothetical protein